MKTSFRSTLCLVALCAIAIQGLDSTDASADLLSKDELKSCSVHVVGIYSPADHGNDDRVFVEVKPTREPIILVLSGYFGAQWNLEFAPKANVRQIIVAGYFEHSVDGVPDDIPLEMITYFPKGDSSREDYFWAYSWHTQYGRKLRSRLKEITGSEITTFQGEYSGDRFVVDGKLGLVAEDGTKQTQPARAAEASDAALDLVRESGMHAKFQHRELLAKYGASHPAVKQIEQMIGAVEAELKRMGAAPIGAADEAKKENTFTPAFQGNDQRKIIEALVRQSFQLQTQLQMTRIEKAEADLQRIKNQLQERQAAAEKIIGDRINQLVKMSESQADEDADVPASLLSSEGWTAWRERDYRTALKKFQTALSKEPDNETARNGLGWTYFHLKEYDKAILEFRTILKTKPIHPAALNGIGQSLLAQGKFDEAETELLKTTEDLISKLGEAETVRRGTTASWMGLIQVYLRQKDYASAKKWCERYLKHKPNDKMMSVMLQQATEKGE
jgi:Tfp pilus assembly protein PilF